MFIMTPFYINISQKTEKKSQHTHFFNDKTYLVIMIVK